MNQRLSRANVFASLILCTLFTLILLSVFPQHAFAATDTWEPIGPDEGYVLSMYDDGTTLYAGTDGATGGVYASTDGGATWSFLGTPGRPVYSLYSNGAGIIAGTLSSGVYKSDDGGANWTQVTESTGKNSQALFYDGTYLYAAASDVVLRSADSGNTWVAGGTTGYTVNALYADTSYLYAGTSNGGVFRSDDNGDTWAQVNGTSPNNLTHNTVRSLSGDGTYLYAGTNLISNTSTGGVFKSSDSGDSWVSVTPSYSASSIRALYTDGTVLIAGTDAEGIYKSTDGGSTWSRVGAYSSSARVICLIGSGTTVYAGAIGGVIKSTDSGDTWAATNSGIQNANINDYYNDGTYLYAVAHGGIYRSADQGTTWTLSNTGLSGAPVVRLCGDGSNLYAATEQGVFRSNDSGVTWEPINNGFAAMNFRTIYFYNNALFAGTYGTSGGGIFKSTNQGDTWTAVYPTTASIYTLYGDDTYLYSAGQYRVMRSADNGVTWTSITTGLPTSSTTYSMHGDGTNLYVSVLSGGLYSSSDQGTTWTQITSFTSTSIRPILCFDSAIYVGTTNQGIFKSTDNGSTWESFNTGLTNQNVWALHADSIYLYAGTYGSSGFRMQVDTLVTTVTANPTSLPVTGGESEISVAGLGLVDGILVQVFDGATALTDAWAQETTSGTGELQTASLTFPANTTSAAKAYTIKVSLDGGVTWQSLTAEVAVAGTTPTPPTPPSPGDNPNNNGNLAQTGDSSFAGPLIACSSFIVLAAAFLVMGRRLRKA